MSEPVRPVKADGNPDTDVMARLAVRHDDSLENVANRLSLWDRQVMHALTDSLQSYALFHSWTQLTTCCLHFLGNYMSRRRTLLMQLCCRQLPTVPDRVQACMLRPWYCTATAELTCFIQCLPRCKGCVLHMRMYLCDLQLLGHWMRLLPDVRPL